MAAQVEAVAAGGGRIKVAMKARGVTLVGVLVSVAILGIIGLIVTALYENMTGLMTKSVATADMENLSKLIQSIVDNRVLCPAAMRTNAGGRIPFAVGNTDIQVDQVWAGPLGGGTQIAVRNATRIGGANSTLLLSDIRLRPAVDSATGLPGAAWVGSNYVVPSGANAGPHVAYNGTLTLLVTAPGADPRDPIKGGNLRQRLVSLTFGVNTATNLIDDCPSGTSVQTKAFDCEAILAGPPVTADYTACQTQQANLAAASGAACYVFYYLAGFDPAGAVVCKCDVSCDAGAGRGGTGTGPGPAPGPGAGPAIGAAGGAAGAGGGVVGAGGAAGGPN